MYKTAALCTIESDIMSGIQLILMLLMSVIFCDRPQLINYGQSQPCTLMSLPRDAVRKRGLCCRPVSVRPSVSK